MRSRRYPAPAYGFAYLESIDTLMHKIGPGEPQRSLIDDEVSHLLDLIERALLDRLPAGTLLLLTSDHGMTPVSPPDTVYVNLGEGAAELAAHVRIGSDPDRHPLAPAGSCRDLFLHAVPGHVDDLVAALERRFGERAEVRRTSELLDGGLFGPEPSAPASRAPGRRGRASGTRRGGLLVHAGALPPGAVGPARRPHAPGDGDPADRGSRARVSTTPEAAPPALPGRRRLPLGLLILIALLLAIALARAKHHTALPALDAVAFSDRDHGVGLFVGGTSTRCVASSGSTADGGETFGTLTVLAAWPCAGSATVSQIATDGRGDAFAYGPALIVSHDNAATWAPAHGFGSVLAVQAAGTSVWMVTSDCTGEGAADHVVPAARAPVHGRRPSLAADALAARGRGRDPRGARSAGVRADMAAAHEPIVGVRALERRHAHRERDALVHGRRRIDVVPPGAAVRRPRALDRARSRA